MTYFPLMLDLRGRPVLLLAGGPETYVKLCLLYTSPSPRDS